MEAGGQMNSSFMKRYRSIAAGRKITSHHRVWSLSFNILKRLKVNDNVNLSSKDLRNESSFKIYNLDSYKLKIIYNSVTKNLVFFISQYVLTQQL